MLSFTLVSSQFKFTRVHRRADIHARGKLGCGDAALLPPVQEAHQGPSAAAETQQKPHGGDSGNGWGGRTEALAEEGGTPGSDSGALPFSTACFPCGIALLSGLAAPCPSFQAQPKRALPGIRPGVAFLLLASYGCAHSSRKGPSLFCPIICTCAQGHS